MGLGENTYYPKIAMGIVGICLLLHWISFGAPNWAKTDPNRQERREHIGLWKYCTYPKFGGERCDDFINTITGDWMKAAQAFMTVSMFGLMVCVGLAAVYAFVMPDSTAAGLGTAGALGATGLLMLIGIGVWAGKFNDYFWNKDPGAGRIPGVLDWAFGVACASCVGTFLAMTLVFLDLFLVEQDY